MEYVPWDTHQAGHRLDKSVPSNGDGYGHVGRVMGLLQRESQMWRVNKRRPEEDPLLPPVLRAPKLHSPVIFISGQRFAVMAANY